MNYVDSIRKLASDVTATLKKWKSIEVDFDAPHRRGRAPTDARSEFLSNRGMGDWAEASLKTALIEVLPSLQIVKYGNDDLISAGDEGFKEFYSAYQDELEATGKRPDLLVFERRDGCRPDDMSQLPLADLAHMTRAANFAIEVRSSKQLSDVYEKVRTEEGVAGHGAVLSFTVKVEDLRLVVRWIKSFGVRHFYAQVFLDAAYMISFEKLLLLISKRAAGVRIEKNERNQGKPTIHVPITHGTRIACFATPPDFTAKVRTTRLGRVDAFVKPTGGKMLVSGEAVTELIGLS